MKANVKRAFVIVLSIFVIATTAHATSVTTTKYKGKTYTVDVTPVCDSATIYFRVKANACSVGDIYVGKLTRSTKTVKKNETLKQAAATLCTVKNVYDNGKMVLGCAASAGSAVCLLASVPTGGTTAIVCSGAVAFTANSGLKDCVQGVSDKIASYLAGERNWKAFATGYGIGSGSWTSAIDNAIDWACTYAK